MGIRLDAATGRNAISYGDDRPPLGELRAQIGVLGETVAQPVETLGDKLAVSSCQRLRALVHLDAGNDALIRQYLDEGSAVRALLAERLVVQDDAADELRRSCRAKEALAVVATVLECRLDADGIETPLDGAVALVRRQDALARCDDGLRCVDHVLKVHARSFFTGLTN